MTPRRIVIVGGGPAGSFAAASLASAGCQVLLFEEKLAWEKPCGGGVPDKAIARWPFLNDVAVERNWINRCELVAPSGAKVLFGLDKSLAIFSRLAFNKLLLDRAERAGVQVVKERIVGLEKRDGNWQVRSSSSEYRADFLVLANGARNPFRGTFSPNLGPENFIVAVGYYIPGRSAKVTVKFLDGLHGYLWLFPRVDHMSAGICGRMQGRNTAELRRILEEQLPEFGLSHEGATFYAHIIPSLTPEALRTTKMCGDGWAMVGDAAGLVDAITGEGLYYALRSAEILSEALLGGVPDAYEDLVRREIVTELERAARIADRFYAGTWLGGSVLERMVQLTKRSVKFRQLMRDLFSGEQEYSTLKQRVYRSLPKIAAEALISTLWREDERFRGSAAAD